MKNMNIKLSYILNFEYQYLDKRFTRKQFLSAIKYYLYSSELNSKVELQLYN